MTAANAKTTRPLNRTGQNLVRILIASYFIAGATGLIEGTDPAILTGVLLTPPWAQILGAALVFSLAYLVLIGLWLRPAALLLSVVVLWSSYLTVLQAGVAAELGHFWRDLALIGALLLTYTESGPRDHARRGLFRKVARARHISPAERVTPRRVAPARPQAPLAAPMPEAASGDQPQLPAFIAGRTRFPAAQEAAQNIFRDDFDIALAS